MRTFTQVFQAITGAVNLPMSTELVGIKLLLAAVAQGGSLRIGWDELLTLCKVRNPGSAVRHLARLREIGVLTYAVNGVVTVEFGLEGLESPGPESSSPKSGSLGAERPEVHMDDERPGVRDEPEETVSQIGAQEVVHQVGAQEGSQVVDEWPQSLPSEPPPEPSVLEWEGAEMDEGEELRAKSARAAGEPEDVVCMFVINTTHACEEINKQTAQIAVVEHSEVAGSEVAQVVADGEGEPERAVISHNPGPNDTRPNDSGPSDPILTPEQQQGYDLLTDEAVGISPAVARRFALTHSFAWICKQVASWWDELHAGVVRGVGALVHRLRNRFSPARHFEHFPHSELCHRHQLGGLLGHGPETSEDRRRAYLPDEYADIIIG